MRDRGILAIALLILAVVFLVFFLPRLMGGIGELPEEDFSDLPLSEENGDSVEATEDYPFSPSVFEDPIVTLPGWIVSASASQIMPSGRLSYVPIFIEEQTQIVEMGTYIQTGSDPGGMARVGLYEWNNGLPETLIEDFGTISIDSSGIKAIVVDITLERGYYYIANVSDESATWTGPSESGVIVPPVSQGYKFPESGSFKYFGPSGARIIPIIEGQSAVVSSGFTDTAIPPDSYNNTLSQDVVWMMEIER